MGCCRCLGTSRPSWCSHRWLATRDAPGRYCPTAGRPYGPGLPSTRESDSGAGRTIQHDDLHDANVLLNGATYRVFDWGDASVSHPFGVFLVLRRAPARSARADEHGPELTRLQDTYLECFSDLAPHSELVIDMRRAEYIAGLGRICSWRRALLTATPEEQAEYAAADSGWLAICVDQPPP
jgi:hypothetical protein